MSVKDCVVERFTELCKQKGFNFNELARSSGVSPSTVYKYGRRGKARNRYYYNKNIV